MKRTPEHSARFRNPSIATPDPALARACRSAASGRSGAVESVLRHALEGTGADRAFLIATAPGTAEPDAAVAACVTREEATDPTPSRSVLRRATAAARPFVLPDVRRDGGLMDSASVRSLALGRIVCLPVPVRIPDPAAFLLLDGNRPAEERAGELRRGAESFAALLALVLDREGSGGVWGRSGDVTSGDLSPLVGRSPRFLAALEAASTGAKTPFPVLVEGESGTGKEGLARRVHAASPRRSGPFVAVNCAAFPEGLLESEMFGAIRGAFTGADRDRTGLFRRAHGGTLFLDEVGDTSPSLQAKLLRALQEGRVRPVGGEEEVEADVRVVAATHRDLRSMTDNGRFRLDLYHRLAFVTIRIPPLRERTDDLPELVAHLLSRLARHAALPASRVTARFLERLARHDWPGNVRELEAVLARARLRHEGPVLDAGDLDLPEPRAEPSSSPASLERRMIESALRESGGGVPEAAKRIGWTRQKLHRRMRALGIPAVRGQRALFLT